jgi:hypothetical protein
MDRCSDHAPERTIPPVACGPLRRNAAGAALLLALLLAPQQAALAEPAAAVIRHQGPCNASTALALGDGQFVMADNTSGPAVPLWLYRSGQEGPPLGRGEIPAAAVAPVAGAHPGLDLEASTRIGPLVYWLGSHGSARAGSRGAEERPNRRRLFATNLGLRASEDGRTITIQAEPVGRPYTRLLDDLASDPRYGGFALAEAARRPDKDPGGLNIEGLAATPAGGLLIGFRNPVPGGKALLVPLTNPNAVLGGETAVFGDPVLLDLAGLGIRSLERVGTNLLIVAGPATGGQKAVPSALYRWSGRFADAPERLRSFPPANGVPFNPEALLADGDSLVLLSDDGNLRSEGKACEDLPLKRQSFRELRITPLP